MNGKVTLVGAGPGDCGLLTLKGKHAIEQAQAVVYDRLVGEDILKLIPENAEKINAGKKSACHLIPQEEINKILVEKAKEGKRVVRLKGGDCFVFGRGGEELEALAENDIEFEVVPGITSALAVPAYAGIPVTHRDFVSSVHIFTAHARAGKEIKIDFESCVKMGGTLVFLMGTANLGYIADGLINAGMRRDMPCAVIENGSLPKQKKYLGCLCEIKEKAACAKSPAVIVVGEVCALSDKLDWFEKLPLNGVTAAVTRPKNRAGALSEKLKLMGAEVLECPCIKAVTLMDEERTKLLIQELKGHDWAVFTSPTGVELFFKAIEECGFDARILGDTKIAAVGSATAAELKKHGIRADLSPKKYDGENLGTELAEKTADERALLIRADKCGTGLTNKLINAGVEYTDFAIYHTEYECAGNITEMINSGKVDFVTFTSASTVRAFMASHSDADLSRFTGVCIGEQTAAEAKSMGIKYIVSDKATVESMIESMVDFVCGRNKRSK